MPNPEQSVYGQSTLRYSGTPTSFPEKYEGNTVRYFRNWTCPQPPVSQSKYTSSDCRFSDTTYTEVMSEGSATGTSANLEHWARGNVSHWEVYYSPSFLRECSLAYIEKNHISDAQLRSADNKAPLVMQMPSDPGNQAVSRPVCTIVYRNIQERKADIAPDQSGIWFVITRNLNRYVDAFGTEVIEARNEYYSTNSDQSRYMDAYCSERHGPDHCTGDSAKVAKENGLTGRLFMGEQYRMRRVQRMNRLTNGFTGFRWWAWSEQVGDRPDPGTDPAAQIWHLTGY